MKIARRSVLTAMAAMSLPARAAFRVPVLVELFTSEGCSSCPPADVLLAILEEKQPVAGADIIVLSEHVDYWNHIGWTDPFSSATYSRRQQDYARRFALESVYTPQMVVDGRTQFIGSDERLAAEAILTATQYPKTSLTLQREGERLTIRSASPFTADVAVSVVIAHDRTVSKVARGENRGRELRHVSVASALLQAGKVRKNRAAELSTELRPTAGPERVIAFAQEIGTAHIVALARL